MNIIAIDLGGTIVKIGLLQDNKIIDRIKLESQTGLSLISSLTDIKKVVNQLINTNNIKISGIGLAFPGLVNNQKMCVVSTNEKYDDGVKMDLVQWSHENWGVPFYMDNDSRLATIGEWQYGSGRGYDNVVMMTIGTGIGSGVIMEGKPLYGKHFQAGSLGGHFVIDYKGRTCSCGNKGCVEALASSFFLPQIIKDHTGVSKSFRQTAKELDFKKIFELASNGDEDALCIRDECVEIWASNVINLIHAYDPEVVVMGGGIMNSAHIIMPRLKEKVSELAWTPSAEVEIVTSELGDCAALYGLKYCIETKYAK